MQTLRQKIEDTLVKAFEAHNIPAVYAVVVPSQRPELGHFQCNGLLSAAKVLQQSPVVLAQKIADYYVSDVSPFRRVSIAGPGFLNIVLNEEFLAAHISEISQDARLGCPQKLSPLKVIIDFGGPNVAKAMHVGHLRSSIIGDALQRLCRFVGDEVISDIHLGDWGLPMGMLLGELQRRSPELPYFNPDWKGDKINQPVVTMADLEEMYPKAAGFCKENELALEDAREKTAQLQAGKPGYRALWRHFVEVSIATLKKDFSQIGVQFDLWLGESDVHSLILPFIEQLQSTGLAKESQGAFVIELEAEADSKPMPPLILLKSDGGVMYGMTDLATILDRQQSYRPDKILYVVDQRQNLHFEQVFRAAGIAGVISPSALEHIGFGTLNGPDGKPFKTRSGGVMRLQDLISEVCDKAAERLEEAGLGQDMTEAERKDVAKLVGLAAIKYADLSKPRLTNYIFDIEQFTAFEGATGPYLLYAAVRIKSVLRKAEERGIQPGVIIPNLNAEELMLKLAELSSSLEVAYDRRTPHVLCDYAYGLAQVFSRFYQNCHILTETNTQLQSSWLSLAHLTLKTLESILEILGIQIPERM